MRTHRYSPWAELAGTDLRLEWAVLASGVLGEYRHRERMIVLDPRMPRRQSRSVLCHELRHAEGGDVTTSCHRANGRQEQRADQTAARLLVGLGPLLDAATIHGQHLSAMAVELNVSDHLLRVRLATLSPDELHYLSARDHDALDAIDLC